MRRAKPRVFDNHGHRDLGIFRRGEGNVERVIALVLFQLGGVVLVF